MTFKNHTAKNYISEKTIFLHTQIMMVEEPSHIKQLSMNHVCSAKLKVDSNQGDRKDIYRCIIQ
jgi:hypothetical protein